MDRQMSLAVFCVISVLALFQMVLPRTAFTGEIDALAQHSQVIVFGKTVGTKCQWAEDTPCILSRTQFQVETSIKGNYRSGDLVTIESQGGVINGMKQRVPDAPSFSKGEYALVFLNPIEKDMLVVTYGKRGLIPCVKKGKKITAKSGKPLSQMIEDVKLAMSE